MASDDASSTVASDDASSTVASDDASSTVASDAKESATEKSEVVSLGQDCVTVDKEIAKQNEYTRDNGIEIRTQEWFDEALKTWARIWPQMNDPDLKSIFRELANTTVADDDAMDNWIAYRTICDTDTLRLKQTLRQAVAVGARRVHETLAIGPAFPVLQNVPID